MVTIIKLDTMSVPGFLPQAKLLLEHLSSSCVALGAVRSGKPIGVIVVELRPHFEAANLLSLFVIEEERRKGIGQKLVRDAEKILEKNGCKKLYVEFIGAASEPEEGLFLSSCGFDLTTPGIYMYSGPLNSYEKEKWYAVTNPHQSFSVENFKNMSKGERAVIERGREIWYPDILYPFFEEESIDPDLSLLLRYKNNMIGWMIMEPFDADTILFKSMFMKKPHQGMGRGFLLAMDAIRNLLHHSHYKNGIVFIESSNKSMMKLAKKRLLHPSIREEVLWRTYKVI
ncbi:GNAT family N-acetyltransferase [Aneurinibacillus sp. REN35]|uniref:GNAT family N-acetyltransferase n=1 Tax=Aneurinibacillus sp. REN35 TaxID=3237286 RepID=UPI0035288BC0